MFYEGEVTSALLECVHVSDQLKALHSGGIKLPKFTFDAPPNPIFGFPSAFIPILSVDTWPGYIGIVHHWFGRQPRLYAKYLVESSEIIEISSIEEEFIWWLVFEIKSYITMGDNELINFVRGIHLDSPTISSLLNCRSQVQLNTLLADKFPKGSAANRTMGTVFSWSATTSQDIGVAIRRNAWDEVWRCLNQAGWQDIDEPSIISILRPHCESRMFDDFAALRLALWNSWGY